MSLRAWTGARSPALLMLAAVFLVHGQALGHAFVWDDVSIMLPVEAYRQADLWAILTGPANGYEYLPLRDLTLVFDMAVWGPEHPAGFHFTNLLILYGVGLAAMAAANALFERHWPEAPPWAAVLAGLVVVVHPLSVEPAHFVAARNTLLATLFALLAMRAFLQLWSDDSASWLLAPAWLLGALLSKASVVALPLCFAGYFIGAPRPAGGARRAVLAIVACFAMAGGATVVHLAGAGAAGVINAEVQGFGQTSAIWGFHKAGLVPWFYLLKWLWPWPLLTHYDSLWVQNATLPWGIALLLVPLAVLAAAWRSRRSQPILWFCALWVAALMLPVLNLLPTFPMLADRYLFPAQFGLGCALALGLAALAGRANQMAAAAVLATLLVAWVGVDLARGREWRGEVALTRATYEHSPQTGRVPYAEALAAAGRTADAIEVLAPEKDWHWAFMSGQAAQAAGRHDEAARYFQQAVSRGGGAYRQVWLHLGQAMAAQGDWLKAADAYRRVATATSPDPGAVQRRTAKEALQRLLPQTAPDIPPLQAHLAQAPDDIGAWIELGKQAMRAGMDELAVEAWENASRRLPENWGISYNLGLAYARIDAHEAAYRSFLAARSKTRDSAEVENQLGVEAARLNRLDAARQHYRLAMALEPTGFAPAYNLLRLEGRAGRFEGARLALQEAKKRSRDQADQEALNALVADLPALAHALAGTTSQ